MMTSGTGRNPERGHGNQINHPQTAIRCPTGETGRTKQEDLKMRIYFFFVIEASDGNKYYVRATHSDNALKNFTVKNPNLKVIKITKTL